MRERREKYLKNIAGIDVAFEENISENKVFDNIAINNSFNWYCRGHASSNGY